MYYFGFRYSNFFSNAITFNYSKRSEWNLDYGYSNHNFLDVYPLRSSGVSYYNRLSLKLNAINDEFLECPNRAFKDGNMMVNKKYTSNGLRMNYNCEFVLFK